MIVKNTLHNTIGLIMVWLPRESRSSLCDYSLGLGHQTMTYIYMTHDFWDVLIHMYSHYPYDSDVYTPSNTQCGSEMIHAGLCIFFIKLFFFLKTHIVFKNECSILRRTNLFRISCQYY